MRLPTDTNLLVCLNSAAAWATPGRVDVVVGPQHGLEGEFVSRVSRRVNGSLVTHEFHVTEDSELSATDAEITHGGVTARRTIGEGAFE